MAMVKLDTLDVSRLPQWIVDALPAEVDAGETITHNGTSFGVVGSDNVYHTAAEAERDVSYVGELHSSITNVIDDSKVIRNEDGTIHGVFEAIEGSELLSLVFVNSEVSDIEMLIESYDEWLQFHEENVFKVGEDFMTTWEWIQKHPMFWQRTPTKHTLWETENGDAGVRHSIYRGDDGKVCVLLETGGSIEPEYLNHYVDRDLIVIESSFEDAIMALGVKILQYYKVSGEALSDD